MKQKHVVDASDRKACLLDIGRGVESVGAVQGRQTDRWSERIDIKTAIVKEADQTGTMQKEGRNEDRRRMEGMTKGVGQLMVLLNENGHEKS